MAVLHLWRAGWQARGGRQDKRRSADARKAHSTSASISSAKRSAFSLCLILVGQGEGEVAGRSLGDDEGRDPASQCPLKGVPAVEFGIVTDVDQPVDDFAFLEVLPKIRRRRLYGVRAPDCARSGFAIPTAAQRRAGT